jgi:uncharacterized protein (TIGR03382 family)
MRHINKITGFAVGGVLLAGMASNAHATSSIQFGPVSTGSLPTDLNSFFTLSQFNPSLGTLTSVTLELDASYDTRVTITNTGTSALNAKAFTEITAILSPYGVTNSSGSLDTSPIGGQFQSFLDDSSSTFSVHALGAGSVSTSGLFTFSDTTTETATDAPTLALFTGGGNINLNYETLTTTTQTISGTGNAISAQVSHANLFGTVVYYYTPLSGPPSGTPEPGVTAFLAAGVLGSANMMLRRRRRRRE